MRRQSFYWTYLVIAILCTAYGGFLLFYNLNHGKGLSIFHLIFTIVGILMLIGYGVLRYFSGKGKAEKAREVTSYVEEKKEVEEEPVKEEVKVEEKPAEIKEEKKTTYTPRSDVVYESRRKSRSHYDRENINAYVRKVGYGPVLRIDDNRIYDMRYNCYYRIEGNNVLKEGYGYAYEINGNRIRETYGSYLYEISGSNINRVFGGYYASIGGNSITTFDLKERYELSDSLPSKYILVIAALLFGSY